jgi:hypothetical protein
MVYYDNISRKDYTGSDVRCKIVLGLTFLELSCKVDRHGSINLGGTENVKDTNTCILTNIHVQIKSVDFYGVLHV